MMLQMFFKAEPRGIRARILQYTIHETFGNVKQKLRNSNRLPASRRTGGVGDGKIRILPMYQEAGWGRAPSGRFFDSNRMNGYTLMVAQCEHKPFVKRCAGGIEMKKAVIIRSGFCFVLLLSAVSGIGSANDIVRVRDAEGVYRDFICTVLEETYESIKIEYQGEEVTHPMVRDGERFVVDVRRRFPQVFAGANSERQSGNYENAFERFRESVEAGEVAQNPWLAPYLRFYGGEVAYLEAEQNSWEPERRNQWFSEAVLRYERLIGESPKHRFAPDAALAMARALIKTGEFERARGVFADIEVSDYPFWIKEEAGLWKAHLVAEEGAHERAIGMLSDLWERHRESNPLLAYRAKFFEGLAWRGRELHEDAESVFLDIGIQAPDSGLQAAAWNQRGLSLFERGQQREALMSFLRVVLMHSEMRREVQRAFYYAARASEEYYGNDDRARDLRDKLRNRFPGSYWTQRLEAE